MSLRHVALVLLPGITDCVEQMTAATMALQHRGAVIVPIVYADFGTVQSIESLAAHVWRHIAAPFVAAALRDRVVVLVGFSMGSFVAQAMYACAPTPLPGGACALALSLVGGAPPGSMRSNAAALGRAFSHFTSEEQRDDAAQPCRDMPLHRGVIAAAYLLTVGAGAGAGVGATGTSVPVLVVHGERDDALPLHNAFELARAFRARVYLIPGTRHNVFRDAPRQVAAALDAWITHDVGSACVVTAARKMGL
jgi:pimeloyl-ACP methyl ester carboxylesterase